MSAAVTAKGQVTIPEKVREHLGTAPGSKVDFSRAPDGSIVLTRADSSLRSAGRFAGLRGMAAMSSDFFIGTHAAVEDVPLLTLDVGRSRVHFPSLKLLVPDRPS